jgi:hypothetical protein
LKSRRSTCRGLCLPATFRLQGLATLLTASSLRLRAGFVSHRQRSWDSPFGAFPSRKVSGALPRRMHPRTVPPAVAPAGDPTGRLDRPRFLGFHPSESPWHPDACLARRLLAAPVGFALLGSFTEALTGISPDLLSRASRIRRKRRTHRHPRVSIGLRLTSSGSRIKTRWRTRQPL